ncbi:MAG: hypothetical protein QM811_08385 [Pirellulales bacterium]
MTTFPEYCEALWQNWLAFKPDVPAFVQANFDLDAAPEPYLTFDDGRNPLVALRQTPEVHSLSKHAKSFEQVTMSSPPQCRTRTPPSHSPSTIARSSQALPIRHSFSACFHVLTRSVPQTN